MEKKGYVIHASEGNSYRWAILALLAFVTLGAAGSVRLIGFAGRAIADEPAGAPLPRVSSQELAAKIREAMKP